MSSALRQAARRLAGAAKSSKSSFNGSQLQQQRMAGDLPVKPNKFIEEAGTRRENIEREFKWDGRTLTKIALAAGVAPYLIYSYTVKEIDHADAAAGRPPRDLWGSSK